MISEKMMMLGKKRSVIREIFEYARKRKQELGEENVFDFSLGNPSVPAPEELGKKLSELVLSGDTVSVHGYTSAQGDLAVREAVARNYSSASGVCVPPELVYMTCGAAASLTITLNALVNQGDEVIVLAPFFPEYRVFAEKAGATLVTVDTTPDEFRIDADAVSHAVTPRTKAVIVNSPNNPTGVVYSEGEIASLARVLEEKEREFRHPIYLISDDPYRKIVYDGINVPYAIKSYRNTVVCYSFSKALSLPGERIGYIIVSPNAENASDLYAAICGAGRALGFVCAPSLFQLAIPDFLDATADLSVYRENRRILTDELGRIGYESAAPDGAFYFFIKALEDDAAAFCERAKEFDLLLVPSDDFGCRGYARIAYCVDTDHVKRSIAAFRKLYESYKGTKNTRD